ncbi:MAG TPA: NAD(P)/FAD-dependent oxidoreductase, partial [Gemmataceae bacterium]|nr:NAD(P)/FAD-dependent oxidoreductase [Gemmataceae bacterium]
VNVTLLDKRNFHLFQPLLYQVATGGLSPANISSPLRAVLKRQANARVLLADVVNVNVPGKKVLLRDGSGLPYDYLIVATGARHHYFGHPEWEPAAPGLKTIEDATEIRRRIFLAFETAERLPDAPSQQKHMTFVIVGAGPTGVELAGAIGELAQQTLRHNFRNINPAQARILLLEGTDRVLPPYPADLSAKAERALQKRGVEVWTRAKVTKIELHAVTVERPNGVQVVPAATVLWAAGVMASPLGKILGEATGAEVDRAGRVAMQPDLTLPGHPEVFVIGDLALAKDAAGKPLPGIAPTAIQQGKYVAETISKRLQGKTVKPFHYHDRGIMATIGRNFAVAQVFGLQISGWLAWMAWLVVHIFNLIAFENRLLVLTQWWWNYLTRNRSARLITGVNDPENWPQRR